MKSQRLVPSRRLLPRLSLARGRYSSDTISNPACPSSLSLDIAAGVTQPSPSGQPQVASAVLSSVLP